MTDWKSISPTREAFGLRIGFAAIGGLILAALVNRLQQIPETFQPLTAAVASTIALTLFLLWAGAGVMKRLSLAVWLGMAFAATLLIMNYNIRVSGEEYAPAATFFLMPCLLFIAHELVSSADISGRRIAPYPTYFDEAWKRGIQLIAALVFTGLFWVILWLGAVLLGMIGLKWMRTLISTDWFYFPATAIALGAGFHLTDVSTRLLASLRTLVLNVLSWLLPVMVVIGVLFVGGLAVRGLEPLWQTRAATMTLVSGCVFFVLLINATYQQGDGDDSRTIQPVLKIAVRVACALLLIFAVLAVYSLWLRIQQYGLTPQRVMAVMAVCISLLFAIGYGISAVRFKDRWMEGIERVNIGMAFVKVGLFAAVLSPLADPRRVSVDDQVGRLTSEKVTVEQFDWSLLAHDTGVYGRNALAKLAKSEDAATATKAVDVIKHGAVKDLSVPETSRPDLTQMKVVHPVGASLPDGFAEADWSEAYSHACLREAARLNDCFVVLKDINNDGTDEVLIASDENRSRGNAVSVILAFNTDGRWRTTGTMYLSDQELDAFRKGELSVTPVPFYEVSVDEKTLQARLSKERNE